MPKHTSYQKNNHSIPISNLDRVVVNLLKGHCGMRKRTVPEAAMETGRPLHIIRYIKRKAIKHGRLK